MGDPKRIINLFLAVLFVLSLSACEINRIKGKVGGVTVEVENENSEKSSGHFYPPGQAKKRNC
jgi:hypothetical protein